MTRYPDTVQTPHNLFILLYQDGLTPYTASVYYIVMLKPNVSHGILQDSLYIRRQVRASISIGR